MHLMPPGNAIAVEYSVIGTQRAALKRSIIKSANVTLCILYLKYNVCRCKRYQGTSTDGSFYSL